MKKYFYIFTFSLGLLFNALLAFSPNALSAEPISRKTVAECQAAETLITNTAITNVYLTLYDEYESICGLAGRSLHCAVTKNANFEKAYSTTDKMSITLACNNQKSIDAIKNLKN